MNAKRILVPTDFSSDSDNALSLAITLADGRDKASITLLHVIENSVPEFDEELGVLEPEVLRTKMQMLAAARGHDVQMESKIVNGVPSKEILKTAQEDQIELIVMGTHGRTRLVELLVGSTAQAVMRHATCPVATLRDNSLPSDD